jgi:hypothetical protein
MCGSPSISGIINRSSSLYWITVSLLLMPSTYVSLPANKVPAEEFGLSLVINWSRALALKQSSPQIT